MVKNVRENFQRQLTKQMDQTVYKEYGTSIRESYIDYYNTFVGKVIDNNDPDKLGRCKIRVYGVFGGEIPNDDLPWATPDMNFVGSKLGSFVVPPVDALVKVYFNAGDIYQPHYTTKVVDENNQPSQKDTDYPDNMVLFETDDGDYLTVNRKTKETTFNHNSGTKIVIDKEGSIEITVRKDQTITTVGDLKLNHTGSLKVQGIVATPIPPPGGPLCALPSCLYTGAPHSGNTAPTGPPVP